MVNKVGKKVLVVDDAVTMRRMLGHVLQSGGYLVSEAEHGEAGLRCAREGAYDLILTDYNMPHMDGISMLRAIRRLEPYAMVPIMVITTEFGNDLKLQGREAGATGWMLKPVHPERLLEMVRRLIG
ncbi:response regulator [Chromobacterium haemolyticum]|uniref:response regulator n=1 Tax=Chromobacterium haemolyticum TaxID=394935 RepID=UPI0009DA0ECB|nr:response regulator [Chromobacterium haemolyticum]OQS33852.1 response regulator [Chromobacterium haemolyticum]